MSTPTIERSRSPAEAARTTCMRPIGPAAPITATRSPGAKLAVGWDRRVALGRGRAGRPDPAGQVVVDAADVERDRAIDGGARR